MQIKKITEPRVGFVYKHKDTGEWFHIGMNPYYEDQIEDMAVMCHFTEDGYQRPLSYDAISEYELIGALNITHRIEDGKPVEIPRGEIEVGDVIEYFWAYGDGNSGWTKAIVQHMRTDKGRYIKYAIDLNEDGIQPVIGGDRHYAIRDLKRINKLGIYGVHFTFD